MRRYRVTLFFAGLLLALWVGCGGDDASGPGQTGLTGLAIVGSFVPVAPLVYVEDITVSGSFAYLADNFINTPGNETHGLYVVDVSTPSQPKQAGFVKISSLQTVHASGAYLYVGTPSRLYIYSLADPKNPVEVGVYGPANVTDVHVQGSYAYVADKTGGLLIVNVTNKSLPTLTGSVNPPGDHTQGVFVDGSYAYVTDTDSGLAVVSVASPAAPTVTTRFSTTKSLLADDYAYAHAHASGNYLYVADLFGLRVFNVTNKSSISKVASFDPKGPGMHIWVEGTRAYLVDQENGVRLIDITSPAAPKEFAYGDSPGLARGIHLSGGYIYIADYADGMCIFKIP